MGYSISHVVWFLVAQGLVCGCGGAPAARHPLTELQATADEPLGEVSRAQVIETRSTWADAHGAAAPIEADVAALREVPAGAEVTVFFAFWCGDSRREVPAFVRALDAVGDVPFAVRYVSVDRAKSAAGFTEGADLRYVPTFVVARDGQEVGRIVESAPGGVVPALVALLRAEASGVISGRADL